MSDILPDDFKWPEIPEADIDMSMPAMKTALHGEGVDPGFNHGGNPENTASHDLDETVIEVFPEELGEQGDPNAFSMRNVSEDSGSFMVEVHPGWVYSLFPPDSANERDPFTELMPEINGQPLNERVNDEYPRIEVSPGDVVAAKIERDDSGQIIPPVRIVVREGGEDTDPGIHYQPPNPDEDGVPEMFLLWNLFQVDDDGSGGIVSVPMWQADIILTPFLWTGENIGEGSSVFKQHNRTAGTYEFRNIKGCWGASVGQEGDSINIDVVAENVGFDDPDSDSSSGAGGTLLIDREEQEESGGEDICEGGLKFKALAQGAGDDAKQIRVTNEDEKVRIHGNGINGLLQFLDCAGTPVGHISWEDGLITTSGQIIVTLGDCTPEDTTDDIPT